jgi:hypothetical protein
MDITLKSVADIDNVDESLVHQIRLLLLVSGFNLISPNFNS